MSPRLPTELLAHILALACADEPALARRAIREAFRLVCREWCASFDRWEEVFADGVSELDGLLRQVSGDPPAGQRIRRASIELGEPCTEWEPDWLQGASLVEFLAVATNVEGVELKLALGVLSDDLSAVNNLRAVPSRVLGRLTRLRSLSLTGILDASGFSVQDRDLARFVGSCPALQTLRLKDLEIDSVVPGRKAPIIGSQSTVRRLTLDNVGIHFQPYVPALPAQLTDLAIVNPYLYAITVRSMEHLASVLLAHKDQLRSLTLVDRTTAKSTLLSHVLGELGPTLARLVNLRKLEISPAATDNLAQTVAPLVQLQELSLTEGEVRVMHPPSAEVLCAVMNGPAPLRQVAISAELVELWTAEGQQQAVDTARRKGIAFVQLDD